MAGLTHSIGSFTFLSLEGQVGMRNKRLEVLSLPYANGESLRSTGTHSDIFRLQSCVDRGTYTIGLNLLDSYAAYIGGGPKAFVWRSVDYGTLTTPLDVEVLGVSMSRIVVANGVVGGLSVSAGANGVMVYADWELRLVPAV